MREWLLGSLLVLFATVVYGRGLATLGLTAEEYALTSRAADLLGQASKGRMPSPYVQIGEDLWLAPLPAIASAGLAKLAPSVWVLPRWTAVVCGVADVVLLYLFAARLSGYPLAGFVAALVLLFTPAHAQFSRIAAPEGIWPLPFVLGWALSLTVLKASPSSRSRWLLGTGMASLAASAYTQASAVLFISAFVVVTILMVHRADDWRIRDAAPAGLAFGVVLLPLLVWYAISGGANGVAFGEWLKPRVDVRLAHHAAFIVNFFWVFFSPSHLFLTRGARGLAGLFLTPTVVPMAIGVHALVTGNDEERGAIYRMRLLSIAGSAVGPLTAAACSPPFVESRALVMLPFGVLLAIHGSIVAWRRSRWRAVLVVVGIASAIQAMFCFV